MIVRSALAIAVLDSATMAAPASAATFYFVRHAESTANTGEASTPEEIVNPPLTALGQQRALDLAGTLSNVDMTTIYVSKYQRTQLTIVPTAFDHDLTPIVDPTIHEWSFGSAIPANSEFRSLFAKWGAGDYDAKLAGAPDSESLTELNARVLPAYAAIVDAHANEDGVVAIVGHGGSIGWTLPFFAQNVSLDFAFAHGLHNTAIVKAELGLDGKFYVTEWDGIAFNMTGPAPVPLPASGLLLLFAVVGAGCLRAARRGRDAA